MAAQAQRQLSAESEQRLQWQQLRRQQQQQEEFVKQWQTLYVDFCRQLSSLKDALEFSQEVLLWRQPVVSLGLFLATNFVLWYLFSAKDNLLVLCSNAIIWLLLADAFWIAASKKEVETSSRSRSATVFSQLRSRITRATNDPYLSFAAAHESSNKPLSEGECLPYEVVCLRLSYAVLWLKYFKLALINLSTQQPFMLSVLLGGSGIILISIGYFVSFFTLMYATVMIALLAPVFHHYSLLERASTAVHTMFPVFIERIQMTYHKVASLLRKLPESEFTDLSLQPVADSDRPPPYNPQHPQADPSMTLPPFDAEYNPLVSMTFTPQGQFSSVHPTSIVSSDTPGTVVPPLAPIDELEVADEVVESEEGSLPSVENFPSTDSIIEDFQIKPVIEDDIDSEGAHFTVSSSGAAISQQHQQHPLNSSTPLGGASSSSGANLRYRDNRH